MVAIGPAAADLGQGSVVEIGLALVVESAAEIDPVWVDPGWEVEIVPESVDRGSEGVTGLVLAVMGPVQVGLGSVVVIGPESVDLGSEGVIGQGLATIGLESVDRGPEGVIDPESVDLGSEGVIGQGLATIGLESVDLGQGWVVAIGRVYRAIDRDFQAEMGPSPAAVRGREPAAAACSGLAVAIGPDCLAPVQEPGVVASAGLETAIGLDGPAMAIDRESQAAMVASLAATGPDGLAIVPESGPATSAPAISGPAISGMSAITSVLSTGPITAETRMSAAITTMVVAAAAVAAGAAATGV